MAELENILPELKTVLPNANFVIEGYVDSSSLRCDATSPLEKPKRSEGSFGDHIGYYTLPEPYPVFHVTAITHRHGILQACYASCDGVF